MRVYCVHHTPRHTTPSAAPLADIMHEIHAHFINSFPCSGPVEARSRVINEEVLEPAATSDGVSSVGDTVVRQHVEVTSLQLVGCEPEWSAPAWVPDAVQAMIEPGGPHEQPLTEQSQLDLLLAAAAPTPQQLHAETLERLARKLLVRGKQHSINTQ